MPERHVYTISDAARSLGKVENRKLIRKLIALKKIDTFRVGNSTCIDQQGFDVLSEAVHAWDNRLRLTDLAAS